MTAKSETRADRPTREYDVRASGKRTRILEAGDGPPLLLVPSAFLRARTYREVIGQLAGHFRVVAAEMPGSGGSERVRRPWGFEDCADWAASVLDALGLGRALMLGHSDSGGMGVILAARHPSRLDGLVVVDAVGAHPGASWPRLMLGRLRDAIAWEPGLSVRLAVPLLANLAAHPGNVLHHIALAASTAPLEAAPGVAVPTLIAWGLHDHTLPPACAERLRAAIPGSRLHWSGASHDWLFQHPAELAGVVADFARGLGLLT